MHRSFSSTHQKQQQWKSMQLKGIIVCSVHYFHILQSIHSIFIAGWTKSTSLLSCCNKHTTAYISHLLFPESGSPAIPSNLGVLESFSDFRGVCPGLLWPPCGILTRDDYRFRPIFQDGRTKEAPFKTGTQKKQQQDLIFGMVFLNTNSQLDAFV